MSSKRSRSVSAPSLPVYCSSYNRERTRKSDVAYERGKDKLAHWIGAWGHEELCSVLQSLLTRCPLKQMEYLWTAMESIPHRDFLHNAENVHSSGTHFRPLSTPLSRDITVRLKVSRRPENIRLHRAHSAVVNSEVTSIRLDSHRKQRTVVPLLPEATLPSKLPGLQRSLSATPTRQLHPSQSTPSTPTQVHPSQSTPSTPITRGPSCRGWYNQPSRLRKNNRSFGRCVSTPPTRILTPMRRHMQPSSGGVVSPKEMIASLERDVSLSRSHMGTPPFLSPKRAILFCTEYQDVHLPGEALEFLTWFSELNQDWQQQELLQLIIWNLDQRELYHLATLLMSRQYRDFISRLPESLAYRLLSYVPAKDILRNCCRVSRAWNERSSSEALWEVMSHQGRMGLPLRNFLSWKQLYIDDLKLKRNWRRGKFVLRSMVGHTKDVLCVRIKENLVATGSADRAIRIWNLTTGECLRTLCGHTKSVWCVCFYGKNLLLSGSSDGAIKIWNYKIGSCERTLDGHNGPVWAIQQKKEILISGGHDKMAILWDIRRCRIHHRLEGHQGVVFAVELDDSTEVAYSGGGDKTVRQWEVATGVCLRVVRASKLHPVMNLQWDKGYLVSSAGGDIALWSVEEYMNKLTEFKGHEDRVESLQLRVYHKNKRSGLLLSSSRDGSIKCWDLKSGRCFQTLITTAGGDVKMNCARCDEVHIVGVSDSTVRVWDFHPHKVANEQMRKAQLQML